jgi:hypothetical protein
LRYGLNGRTGKGHHSFTPLNTSDVPVSGPAFCGPLFAGRWTRTPEAQGPPGTP